MKIYINIRDNIDPEEAVRRVAYVISQGRISENNTKFCLLTTWKDDIAVHVNKYRKSDCFEVFKISKS